MKFRSYKSLLGYFDMHQILSAKRQNWFELKKKSATAFWLPSAIFLHGSSTFTILECRLHSPQWRRSTSTIHSKATSSSRSGGSLCSSFKNGLWRQAHARQDSAPHSRLQPHYCSLVPGEWRCFSFEKNSWRYKILMLSISSNVFGNVIVAIVNSFDLIQPSSLTYVLFLPAWHIWIQITQRYSSIFSYCLLQHTQTILSTR